MTCEGLTNVTQTAEETDEAYLMALATEIGWRIEEGKLPPQDENGFYIL